ncbi:hypothetical protein [Photorhabdus caribbeanensis]|uniref:hypothetical protein n=1 Tax=Photorhabdus caribbeanensis TaxID=1004165 RepID=UPI001BD620A0|nr:hypothetical protein [Photorhabdus caribbeanensis]MBS9426473.1 hypothetical protein [Photorhabdus caribbeanensis]
MNIRKIEWLSKDAEEAILFITDGQYECIAFSHPCNYNEGDYINSPLFAITVKGIQKEKQHPQGIIKNQNDTFSQFVIAELLDRNSNLVKVGNIVIELDEPIPNDISSGEIISFGCGRIDTM